MIHLHQPFCLLFTKDPVSYTHLLYWVKQGVRQNIFSEELTLKSTSDSRYQWMVGAFFFSDSYKKNLSTDVYKRQVQLPDNE